MPLNNKFIIIVPVYNAENYIERCLNSILTQTYKNYKLVVVDDQSTDSTNSIITDVYNKNNHNFTVCRLDNHYGSPIRSFKTGVDIFSNDPEDILVTVDGDDQLFDKDVLDYLNFIYENPNILMTYGSFIPESGSYSKFGKQVEDIETYRRSGKWSTSHLRTLKNKVFKSIYNTDLKDVDGDYYKFAGDAALMFPALELCGNKRAKFIDRVMYIYNDLNPLNEMKIGKEDQLRIGTRLRNMPSYSELT